MSSEYFANLDSDELCSKLAEQEQLWDNFLVTSRMFDRAHHALLQTYGQNDLHEGTDRIAVRGESGQLSSVRPNHWRKTALNVYTLTTSQRPALKPRASNTDESTQTQTLLAESQLDYYLSEKRIGRNLKKAAWQAIRYGEGFVCGEWDATAGSPVGMSPDTVDQSGQPIPGKPVMNGDLKFYNPLFIDVIRDFMAKEEEAVKWWMVRRYMNKFELAAKFPELAEQIVSLSGNLAIHRKRFELFEFRRDRQSDMIPVRYFYHEKTDAVPSGRLMVAVDSKTWLMDGPLPYKRVPVFQIHADTIDGTPFGYTSLFDALGIQQAVDTQTSIAVTNQKQGGVNVIVARKGSGVDVTKIAEGYSLLEHDSPEPPQAMSFTNTPKEVFAFRTELVEEMGQIGGGLTGVTQGTDDREMSGARAAMADAQSLRFNSALQESYKDLCEDVGTFLIQTLQQYGDKPRMAKIAGQSKSWMVREYTPAKDLEAIDSVTAETVDPLFATSAGKQAIADKLLDKGLLQSPQQYVTLVKTGNLEVTLEGEEASLINIKSENERLAAGTQCVVVPTDNHPLHLQQHAAVWANPEVRENPAVYQVLMEHFAMHMNVWRQTDPGVLMALNIPPPAPIPPPAMQNEAQTGAVGPVLGDPTLAPAPAPGSPSMAGPPIPGGGASGTPPKAPLPDTGNRQPNMPNMPTNPATGQPWNPNNGGLQ